MAPGLGPSSKPRRGRRLRPKNRSPAGLPSQRRPQIDGGEAAGGDGFALGQEFPGQPA